MKTEIEELCEQIGRALFDAWSENGVIVGSEDEPITIPESIHLLLHDLLPQMED